MKYDKRQVVALLIIAAIIILPTGTPEDFFTTVPLLAWLGTDGYFKLALGVIALLVLFGVSFKDVIKKMEGG
jgi:hypothetical protein